MPDASRAAQVTVLGFSSAGVAIGTLGLIDVALQRPVSRTTLANEAAELRARGNSASYAEVERVEADLRHYAVRPIPSWAYGATQLVAGAVAMSPAFIPSTPRDDRALAVGLGCALAIPGAMNLGVALATDNPYDQYEKGLAPVRLSPVGPRGAAGLWAIGTF